MSREIKAVPKWRVINELNQDDAAERRSDASRSKVDNAVMQHTVWVKMNRHGVKIDFIFCVVVDEELCRQLLRDVCWTQVYNHS